MDETALVLSWALDVHVAFLAPRTPAHSGAPSVTRGLQATFSSPLSQRMAESSWRLLLNVLTPGQVVFVSEGPGYRVVPWDVWEVRGQEHWDPQSSLGPLSS